MAREILRGVKKSRAKGDVAITRWVTTATFEALKRLRGQGFHAHPTEGEVIDQAVSLFDLHKKMACDALMPSGNGRRCQQWSSEHGDFHVNFEVGARWPRVELSVGESVGDGALRGYKVPFDRSRNPLPVIDDLPDPSPLMPNPSRAPWGTIFGSDMPVVPPASPAEQALRDEQKSLKEWADGPTATFPPVSTETFLDTAKGRDETIVQAFCQHCGAIQETASAGPCPKCFAAGHRNTPMSCFVCEEKNG